MATDHLFPLQGEQDGGRIAVRGIAEGTVALSETILSVANNNGLLVDGKINVQGVSYIAVRAKGEFGTGPLTAIDIIPEFADGEAVSWAYATVLIISAGTMTLQKAIYRISTEAINYSFIIPNPGAMWMRFKTGGTGTITGSWLTISIIRQKFKTFQHWEE